MDYYDAEGRRHRKKAAPDYPFHDPRHDVASTLTMGGANQRMVMEILGHRDPRMTLRYQHLAPEYLKEAMRTLDGTFHQGTTDAESKAR